jgi:hypothetical protein
MKSMNNKRQTNVGMAWYRPEQWDRLRELSADVEVLEANHAEWLTFATRTFEDLRKRGIPVEKVDVDVEEIWAWCQRQGRPMDGKTRADYVVQIMNAG